MTQPQALQPPLTYPRPEAMTAAADDVAHFAAAFDLFPSSLCSISAETIYVWSEQLAAASRKLETIARKREAQGE
jgi:hypothetical protein